MFAPTTNSYNVRGVMWEPCCEVYRSDDSDTCVNLRHFWSNDTAVVPFLLPVRCHCAHYNYSAYIFNRKRFNSISIHPVKTYNIFTFRRALI